MITGGHWWVRRLGAQKGLDTGMVRMRSPQGQNLGRSRTAGVSMIGSHLYLCIFQMLKLPFIFRHDGLDMGCLHSLRRARRNVIVKAVVFGFRLRRITETLGLMHH